VYSPNKVSVYGSEGEFYKIKYANQWAYIYKSYVSNGKDTQSKPKEVESKQENNDGISGDEVVAYASKFMGVPYVWGGSTPAGFDCSGLVQYVYKNFGINMPRTTMDQVNVGTSVSINNLQKGDLIYFRMNASDPNQVSHVGIYIGNNKFMHSPKPGDVAKTSEINSYYTDHFAKARRMIK
ncbi:MAG: C40 family peptidase, partial [Clostridiaceae bacterium]|nr:C40 family peptidase [Clostridiaceae bacterium]